MALAPGVRFGVYEVTAQLDEGGMGVVWRGRDSRLQRDVALKVLPDAFAGDAERLARFEREARTLASLNHPNIAQVYGLEAFQDSSPAASPAQVLVMELVDGPTLADRIAQGPLPLDEALPIARQIAEALEAAHEQGIVHRDLKPANVKVRPDGTVKVLDFGLAKAIEPSAAFSRGASQSPTITTPAMTQDGVILGTAAYMSPEQARGKPVDRRTDLWAFGCVLYEMLTGRQAFEGEDVMAILARIQEREPDFTALPGRTPSAIRRLIRRSLVKDPRRRLSEASTARLEIDEARTAPEDTVTAAMSPWWRRTLMPAIVVLAASLATGVAVWLVLRPASRITLLDVVPPRTAPLFGDVGLGVYRGGRLFALAPDGSGLIYVSTGSDGRRRLMRRAMDEAEPTLVAGGEGASSPFISPDGQWVAYFNGFESLMRVHMEGGVPRFICNLPAVAGQRGTWRADGTIVFTTFSPSALWSVPETGGEPERLLLAKEGEAYRSPQWLPDGSGVLLTIAAVDSEDTRVVVFDWLTREIEEEVWRGGNETRYVPSGHLVYAAAGVLWAVPFDPDARQATGTAFRVLDEDTDEFEVSRDGTLAFMRGGPAGGTRLMLVDREGIEMPIDGLEPGGYFQPRFSPDESRVAYYHADTGNDVEVLNLQDGRVNRVTQDPHQDWAPAWVDDEWLVFTSNRSGAMNVHRKRADGSGSTEQLTNNANIEALQAPLDVTADGTITLMFPTPEGLQVGLKTIEPESEIQPLAPGGNPTISPDGLWIAYEAVRNGLREILVQPLTFEGGPWQVSNGGGSEPLFAKAKEGADRELFYRRQSDGAMMSVRYTGDTTFRSESPKELFPDNRYRPEENLGLRSYDVSRDGSRFLMVQRPDPADSPLMIGIYQDWLEEVKRLESTR